MVSALLNYGGCGANVATTDALGNISTTVYDAAGV